MNKKIYKENLNSKKNYTIISFFTNNYKYKAEILVKSLNKLNLNYKIFEIPEIHCSKSIKGSNNFDYTQPRLILELLNELKSPVLFVDTDLVFREEPTKINEFKNEKIDFAIYNWVEDLFNDGFKPVIVKVNNEEKKFYRYNHSIDFSNQNDKIQLYSSGAVAYFSNSNDSKTLLNLWHENIKLFPKSPDDQTLDYTFNFIFKNKLNIKWFDKSYCRYNFWIFSRPIIDHPDNLNQRIDQSFKTLYKKDRINYDILKKRNYRKFSKNYLLDIEKKKIFSPINQELIFIKNFDDKVFV